jgi:hypothetical protein
VPDRDLVERMRETTARAVDPPEFAQLVQRAERRRRTHAVTAVTVAAAVVVVAVGAVAVVGNDRAAEPVETPTPSVRTTGPVEPIRVAQTVTVTETVDAGVGPGTSLAISGLETGAEPGIPWADAGVLHVDGRELAPPRTGNDTTENQILPLGDGAVRLVRDDPEVIQVISAQGRVVREVKGGGLIASPDLGEVAWWEQKAGAVVFDRDGTLLFRGRPPDGRDYEPAGWLGPGDVVFVSGSAFDQTSFAFRTSGGPIRWAAYAETVSPNGLVLGAMPVGTETECLSVLTADPPGVPLWSRCFAREGEVFHTGFGTFSGDGEHLLMLGGIQTGGQQNFVAVLDARTGDQVWRYEQGVYANDRDGAPYQVMDAGWEDGAHVLMVVHDRTAAGEPTAIVRCDLAGHCELAASVGLQARLAGSVYP